MLKTGDIIYKVTLEGYDIPCVVVKKYKVGQRLSKVVSRETIRGVEYVNLLQKLSNGPKVSLLRPIHFNSLQDEEFCYYGRKKRRGYIAPYDKESV